MCDREKRLLIRHSYHTPESAKTPQLDVISKSELKFSFSPPTSNTDSTKSSGDATSLPKKSANAYSTDDEYYKKYDHDELPVKDSDSSKKTYTKPLHKGSLTNSDLDNLERRIYKNVSQELQTDDSSLSSLESNIKFFKTTVEKVFENFYSSMNDFEHYKTRFQAIINKSKEGSIEDMEDFIKDMFDNIMSSDNSHTIIKRRSGDIVTEAEDNELCATSYRDCDTERNDGSGLLEAYKNDYYSTDSTEDNPLKSNRQAQNERLSIFLLNCNPCGQIKLDGRNILSEINVKDNAKITAKATTEYIASADNFNKLASKRLELEKYIRQQQRGCNARNAPDRDLPVKMSFPKKNIHLNEDFSDAKEKDDTNKSFLTKLCNILCRRFRRTSLP